MTSGGVRTWAACMGSPGSSSHAGRSSVAPMVLKHDREGLDVLASL